jgi:peroxiredoxin
MSLDPTQLPDDLPRPVDDGTASHLPGTTMPELALPSTAGEPMRVDVAPAGFRRLIIYAYPLTGLPGVENPGGWDAIPGARGCTPESCGFRDHAAELAELGAAVAGLSTQSPGYQREAADRLRLPFPLLSDAGLGLTQAIGLPVFTVEVRPEHDGGGQQTLIKRITLVISDGVIEKVFYPIFPPDRHADEILAWIRDATAR